MKISKLSEILKFGRVMWWATSNVAGNDDVIVTSDDIFQNQAVNSTTFAKTGKHLLPRRFFTCFVLQQGFPTGGTRAPKGYEIEHQGVRDWTSRGTKILGSQSSLYISYRAIYISKFFRGSKNALTWQRGTSSKKGWEPLYRHVSVSQSFLSGGGVLEQSRYLVSIDRVCWWSSEARKYKTRNHTGGPNNFLVKCNIDYALLNTTIW